MHLLFFAPSDGALEHVGIEEKEESFSGKELEHQINWDATYFCVLKWKSPFHIGLLNSCAILLSHTPSNGILFFVDKGGVLLLVNHLLFHAIPLWITCKKLILPCKGFGTPRVGAPWKLMWRPFIPYIRGAP